MSEIVVPAWQAGDCEQPKRKTDKLESIGVGKARVVRGMALSSMLKMLDWV